MRQYRWQLLFLISGAAILLFTSLFWRNVGRTKAYNDDETHPALTQEAVKFYNKFFDENLTREAMRLVMKGAFDEDRPPRWLNHFYDPVYNRGLSAGGVFDTLAISSKRWSQNRAAQAAGDTRLLMAGILNIPDKNKANSDYTWQRALDDWARGDKRRALEGLGHTLHLIQDATVPPHTRDDPHPHFPGLHTGSPYEIYAKRFAPRTINLADPLAEAGHEPVIYDNLDKYFNEIASYTNNSFYSEDTILADNYFLPKIKRASIGRHFGREVYIIHGSGQLNSGEDAPLFIVKNNFGIRNFGKKQKETINSDLILPSYWSRLSREAVINGAGIIHLFLEQAKNHEIEEEEKGIMEKIKDITDGLFSQAFSFINRTDRGIETTADVIVRHLEEAREEARKKETGILNLEFGENVKIENNTAGTEEISTPADDFADLSAEEETIAEGAKSETFQPKEKGKEISSPEKEKTKENTERKSENDEESVPVDNSKKKENQNSSEKVAQSEKDIKEDLGLPPSVDFGGSTNSEPEPTPPPDETPPASVSDLSAVSNSRGEAKLTWMAPGDDENDGTASSYDVRYAIFEITESNWASADQVLTLPQPKKAGQSESLTISDLTSGETYYFTLKSTDDEENTSDISNVSSQIINAESKNIVISEVQIGDDEFVELYNPTSATTDLGGYYFSYYSQSKTWPDPWRNKPFPTATSDIRKIPANGFYLIGLSGYPETSEGNATADWQPYSSKQLSNSNGSIAIYPFDPEGKATSDLKTDVIDVFSWGDPDHVKEGDPYSASNAGESAERKDSSASTAATLIQGGSEEIEGNAWDTDDNSADFVTQSSPNPQNTTSFKEPRKKPDKITDLAASASENNITLTWTAPGDDDTATSDLSYDIRYSTSTITESNWTSATVFSSPPAVKAEGEAQTVTVADLDFSTTYYFGIKTEDNTDLSADLSNIASQATDDAINLADSDWSKFGANLKQNNRVVTIGPATPDISWTYDDSDSGGFSEPVLSSDGKTLYVGSGTNKIFALNVTGATPEVKWTFPTESDLSITTKAALAVARDGRIYAGSSDGHLYAIKPDGTELWKYPNDGTTLHNDFKAPAIGPEGTIYFGRGDQTLYAVNPDGTLKWSRDFGTNSNLIPSTPAIDSEGNIYTGFRRYFYKLSPEDGATIWSYSALFGNAFQAAGTLSDDESAIYVGDSRRRIYSLKTADSVSTRENWNNSNFNGIASASPSVDSNGNIYLGDRSGYLVALDSSGNQLWTYNDDSTLDIRSAAAIASQNNLLYAVFSSDNLVAIDLDASNNSGTVVVKWERTLSDTISQASSLDGDGNLYVPVNDGKIIQIGG